MANVTSKNIRNICLIGHSADGKTSLAEAMLYITKGTDRLGNITDGNTVCDYDPEEIRRGFSISASVAPVMYNDVKINVLDTPGYLDFKGEISQAMRVAGAAIIVVSAKSGIEVGTELAYNMVTKHGSPHAFFLNKLDDPEVKFDKVFASLREKFGNKICPVTIPVIKEGKITAIVDLLDLKAVGFGKGENQKPTDIPAGNEEMIERYHNMLLEAIAGTDETLMEKYFNGETITREEAVHAIHGAVRSGEIAPVLCGSAANLCGIGLLMKFIADAFPSPLYHRSETLINGIGAEVEVPMREDTDSSVFIFKTVSDQFGKQSFFKVMEGELKSGIELKNVVSGTTEKISHIYVPCGKKQTEVESLAMGDIGVTTKLTGTNTGDTLTSGPHTGHFVGVEYPESFYQRSVITTSAGDEDKITQCIAKLMEEDPTLHFENNAETNQLILSGQGDIQLDVAISKLKNRFGIAVELGTPRIAYRETIRGMSDVQGKHKKQSGGHGQYGDVKIRFSPGNEEGLTFVVSVVGGAVPKNFYPAVEKGLQESMAKGILAGYPMVGVKADLYDGSYHPVDSSEMAFKIAASLAYKEGIPKARPVLLEPYANVKVCAPSDMIGDIMSAFTKRRGRVLGMSPASRPGEQILEAEAPIAEMSDFAIQLRAITQGRGIYTMKFERYEDVPMDVAVKIISDAKTKGEID